jgi:dipeptidyl-peptidase 4
MMWTSLALLSIAHSQPDFQASSVYAGYLKAAQQLPNSVHGGIARGSWDGEGRVFHYAKDGKFYQFDVRTHLTEPDQSPPIVKRDARTAPSRGKQYQEAFGPNGEKAVCRGGRIFMTAPGLKEVEVPTGADPARRIKCGTASWVYGEELDQKEAMWWSPDGKKLAYYRFDEADVPDYYLTPGQLLSQDQLATEAYPKPGDPNPIVDIEVYDLGSKKVTHLDSSFGTEDSEALGHYVFNIHWTPDGKGLLFARMNRRENQLELDYGDADTGACRKVLGESSDDGWVDPSPDNLYADESGKVFFGEDNFLWISERTGFRNIYLCSVKTGIVRALTQGQVDVESVVRYDSVQGALWYLAHDGDVPTKLELHRTDPSDDHILTDRSLSHEPLVAPKGGCFADVQSAADAFPETVICDPTGKTIGTIAVSNVKTFNQLGAKKISRIQFLAADGKTPCYGYLMKPSSFDPKKRYPLLVHVYGGPDSITDEDFVLPDPVTETGCIVAWFDGRGTGGRGTAFRHGLYRQLGQIEVDDQVAGVKSLLKNSSIDSDRIGIYGASYGGYVALLAMERYPQMFRAGIAVSPVTDWRNYDATYSERYMGLIADNPSGYATSSAVEGAGNLSGDLMLFYGTSDENVHPTNTIQLIERLILAGKRYELKIGPDSGHVDLDAESRADFFYRHLIAK